MIFVEIIKNKKFTIFSILLFFYVMLNLLDGERGLISYYDKQKTIKNLINEKESLIYKLNLVDKKNSLLTDNLDLDYLETLYRQKFVVGKKNEKIYIE
jgi:cell division protein DivIC|tara:strand:+ start:164 stop:457 length:294 start_codon:yes stop_codon:yes gene_type:complete